MNLTVEWNEGSASANVAPNESDFYQEVGKHLLEIESIPNTLTVKSSAGDAEFAICKRGKYIKDGIEMPSMYVTERYNSISGLAPAVYPQKYLTCVNPESNNYKFYWLKPDSYGIGATYGRIGSERGEMFGTRDLQNPYPTHMFWIRYYEKLSKGYTDMSDIYLGQKKDCKSGNSRKEKPERSNDPSWVLYHQLMSYAHHVVSENLISESVTVEQVRESRRIFNELGKKKTVKAFNNWLLKLLAVSPRKTRYVDELLAASNDDFAKIIYREENLIAAMEAVAGTSNKAAISRKSFDDLGIEVYLATDKQKNEVMRHLSDTLKPKVKTVYRVINRAHKKRFDAYLKKEGIKKVRQLWHGSRNENWFSIVENGLQLNPNAVITGKMFGHGIYFAPSSLKSWNYTSYRGTYWANGKDDRGFMGLYATAYGDPLNVDAPDDYTQRILKSRKKNCVHAHAGQHLKNDEIIYYSEAAMLLNYIVEFE